MGSQFPRTQCKLSCPGVAAARWEGGQYRILLCPTAIRTGCSQNAVNKNAKVTKASVAAVREKPFCMAGGNAS